MDEHCIGIDLGSSNSCVSVWHNGHAEVIPNEYGERTMPSIVSFTSTEKLVGGAAKQQNTINPENTITNVKRIIGRKYDDPVLQKFLESVKYRVVNDDNRPVIVVTYKGEEYRFSPEEISAFILTKLKETAEKYLGVGVTKCVLTCPAYFNDAQRTATKDAARIAGLEVIRLINEPTASSLCYGFSPQSSEGRNTVLVYDFGGLTFDCTILTIEGSVYEVIATHGDLVLGGSDIDTAILAYIKPIIKRKSGIDIYTDKSAYKKTLAKCEECKKMLSGCANASIEIVFSSSKTFTMTLSRQTLNEIVKPYVYKSITCVKNVLHDAKMKPANIDSVLLVGGTTRIPLIQDTLVGMFGKKLNKGVNVDECVAIGAATQAAIITHKEDKALQQTLLIDVCPLSLGLETRGGVMSTLIHRNTPIPCIKSNTFSTAYENQPAVDIKIFEGERARVKDNTLLGKFVLYDLPMIHRPQIEVVYQLDGDGILNISAMETSTRKRESIKIMSDMSRLTPEQIQDAIHMAEKFKEEDQLFVKTQQSRNDIEEIMFTIKGMDDVDDIYEELEKWLEDDHTLEENMECLRQLDENLKR